MGTVIKVHCLYETPFWREEGLSGQVVSDGGIMRITFDNSPVSGTPGVLLGFIEGDEGRIWGRRSLEERHAAVLACLVSYFGEKAGQPYEYLEQNWADEEYSRGCYTGIMPPASGWPTVRLCAHPLAACIGLGQRRRRSGMGTWMVPSNQASAQRQRCLKHWKRSNCHGNARRTAGSAGRVCSQCQ